MTITEGEAAAKRATEVAPPARPPLPPELETAGAALERGDFRQARRLITEVLATNPPEPVSSAAHDLQRSTENDPWAVRLGLLAAAVLALVVGAYIL